jgi:DNA-binding CsgD family transcriptional regulator
VDRTQAPPSSSRKNQAVLSSALYDLYRHRDAVTFPSRIVSAMARCVPCDTAAFIRVIPAANSFELTAWPQGAFDDLDHHEAFALHVRDHPLVAHFRAARDARAWSPYDLVAPEIFRQSALYRKIYQPRGIEYQLVMLLPDPAPGSCAIVLHRAAGDFSVEERRELELLWPHVIQASRNVRSLSRLRDAGGVKTLMEGRGIVVLDRDCNVELCTEQARIWFARYCSETFVRGKIRLPEKVAKWVADQLVETAPARAIPQRDRLEPLILARGDNFLTIRMIADTGRGQHLLVLEEEALNSPPVALESLGLTEREAEVLAWVAQGKSNPETGIILGMSARTVQKHLEHVFEKLGVESRTAAILRAWHSGRYALLAPR